MKMEDDTQEIPQLGKTQEIPAIDITYTRLRAPREKEQTMQNEPVLSVAAITALIAALIALLAAFGLPLSNDQTEAILGFVAIAGPLVAAYFARQRVTPTRRR